ncbi:Leukotriene-B(4) omega-hydroxylase 2 [Seminavis robusta]|uniref:Leukotriene-B(4) omega-hydroxylase 2 n=1 Tax=Seminavis robusta TaxID=568900 RepID=A0A9N8DMC6_9STRA|nr:Leukotriene-B(4) omega-hydroxylase 2 [Seminavis robusta]|eukprot:Sro241_g096250.1 Leukotriene-B(4) omega-hydroxylase 2 (521) ;mRNA; f:8450-10012
MLHENPHGATAALLLLVGSVMFLLYHYLTTKIPITGAPMAPHSHFLWGHLFRFLHEDFHETFRQFSRAANQYGQVGIWIFDKPTLCVFDLEDAKTVLHKEKDRFVPYPVTRHFAYFTGKRDFLILNGRDWKLQRTAVTSTINEHFLDDTRRDCMQVTQIMSRTILRKLDSTTSGVLSLDFEPLMKVITLDILCRTLFDVDMNCCGKEELISPVASAFEFLCSELFKRIRYFYLPQLIFYWLPTDANRQHRQHRRFLEEFMMGIINKKRQALERGDRGRDVMSKLLRAHGNVKTMLEGAEHYTDMDLMGVCLGLFQGGFDTTSITLSAVLYLLALHPEAQDTCVREIQNLGDDDMSNHRALAYCHGAFWEALRLYAPLPFNNRTLSRSLVLKGGLVVPQGADVQIATQAINLNEERFPHPHEFRPERWAVPTANGAWRERLPSDEYGGIPTGNYAHVLSFSAGGRNCVGHKFAQQEGVIVMANLLKQLEFQVKPGYKMETMCKTVLQKPVNGCWLNVSKRA